MEEKIYSLLEKMYIDINKELKINNEAIVDIKNELKNNSEAIVDIKNELKNNSEAIARIENELTLKTNLLFDGYKQNFEIMHRVEEKVDKLSTLVEQQELEIRVIKQAK